MLLPCFSFLFTPIISYCLKLVKLELVACCLTLAAWSLSLWPSTPRPACFILITQVTGLLAIRARCLTPDLSRCTANYPRILEGTEIRAQVWAFIRCDQFTYRKFLRHFYSTATHDQALDDAWTIPKHLRLLYASSKSWPQISGTVATLQVAPEIRAQGRRCA